MILKRLGLIIFIFAFIFPLISFAGENNVNKGNVNKGNVNKGNLLLFDENTPRQDTFSFDIDESERLKPRANDFELINYAPMSNKNGERWVLITVKNTSAGRRFLKSEHLVATFVNEEQINPIDLNESVDDGKVFSKTIFFGVNKFPIVMLEIQP
jgi:hypothetical protein